MTGLTSEEYASSEYWRHARLSRCPLHPGGGCGFRRHSPYPRKHPVATWIARYYCPTGHMTFSLLPDCLAAKLPGSLAEVERVVAEAEGPGTLWAIAVRARPEVEPDSAMRWTRRRVRAVHAGLRAVIGMLPALLAGCQPTVLSIRAALGVPYALPVLREKAGPYLSVLPPPLGFGSRPERRRPRQSAVQQHLGRSPPA